MRIVSGTASGALRLGRYTTELSREARRRLKWMDHYGGHGPTSMVGRILTKLKERGVLSEAPLRDPWQRPRPPRRPYGIRKPKEYAATRPGDIVQVDTAHIQPCPGWNFKHFTARDVATRWDVLEAHSRATAHAAAGFLDTVLARMPFSVKAIQVDGGSEFMAEFETARQRRARRPLR